MSNEFEPGDVRAVWQHQPVEGLQLSLEEIQKRAYEFQRQIKRRNALEYIAALVTIVAVGWGVWTAENTLLLIGNTLIVAGIIYFVYHLWKKGGSRSVPPEAMASDCVAFHRRELERQRELYKSFQKWYRSPFVPGLLLHLIGRWSEMADDGSSALTRFVILIALFVFVFIGAYWLHNKGVKKLDREIRNLDDFLELDR